MQKKILLSSISDHKTPVHTSRHFPPDNIYMYLYHNSLIKISIYWIGLSDYPRSKPILCIVKLLNLKLKHTEMSPETEALLSNYMGNKIWMLKPTYTTDEKNFFFLLRMFIYYSLVGTTTTVVAPFADLSLYWICRRSCQNWHKISMAMACVCAGSRRMRNKRKTCDERYAVWCMSEYWISDIGWCWCR